MIIHYKAKNTPNANMKLVKNTFSLSDSSSLYIRVLKPNLKLEKY
jgi:hypothetical protein